MFHQHKLWWHLKEMNYSQIVTTVLTIMLLETFSTPRNVSNYLLCSSSIIGSLIIIMMSPFIHTNS